MSSTCFEHEGSSSCFENTVFYLQDCLYWCL